MINFKYILMFTLEILKLFYIPKWLIIIFVKQLFAVKILFYYNFLLISFKNVQNQSKKISPRVKMPIFVLYPHLIEWIIIPKFWGFELNVGLSNQLIYYCIIYFL